MIFVDANVPMYLVGSDHPHRSEAKRLLDRASEDRERLVTDAEVLQEILHRYVAINRREAIQPAFDVLLDVVDDVFAVDRTAVERAKAIVLAYERLSARDAIHAATMQLHGVTSIISFDAAFDRVPGLRRIGGPPI